MKIKKFMIGIAVFICIVLGILYTLYRIPREFFREFDGIYYKLGDSSVSKEVTVGFYGYFTNGLWQEDKFEGTIKIGDKLMPRVKLSLSKGKSDIIYYYDEETGDYKAYGTIYTDNLEERLTICVLTENENGSGSWNGSDGYMISAPAADREEALKLSNRLMSGILLKPLE